MENSLKRKRGRPVGDGQRKPDKLLRALVALAVYQKARMNGMTDRKAKGCACTEVKRKFPLVKIGEF